MGSGAAAFKSVPIGTVHFKRWLGDGVVGCERVGYGDNSEGRVVSGYAEGVGVFHHGDQVVDHGELNAEGKQGFEVFGISAVKIIDANACVHEL